MITWDYRFPIWEPTLYITNGYYPNVFYDPFKNQLYILILITYMASQFLNNKLNDDY
jgi:hypothetical protein